MKHDDLSDEQELWLLRYTVAWLPERLFEKLRQTVSLEVLRQIVDEFVDEAREACAGEAFREQVEKTSS